MIVIWSKQQNVQDRFAYESSIHPLANNIVRSNSCTVIFLLTQDQA